VYRRRLDPHRIVHNIKFWAIEIMALIVFLNWAGHALWHELGFDRPAEAKSVQACVAEPKKK
jgi:hypothetical protein